jgi:hypothetical protein
MIRPFTCVCLILAAGSGLYLYQVKQRAFALDAELRGTFHAIDVARDRTRMLRADWALMNDPERLQALATQYLALQPMAPSQLMTMDQLAAALPSPIPPGRVTAPASVAAPDTRKTAPAIDPTQGMPMAEAAPRVLPHTHPTPEVALLQPVPPAPADAPGVAAAAVVPPVATSIAAPVITPEPAAPLPAAPRPLAPLPAAIAIPPLPKVVAASPDPKTAHRAVRHAIPTPSPQPWLADANGAAAPEKARRPHHKAAPQAAPPSTQFYAANEPARLPEPAPRITPPAATVMYSPAAGSSLGMAASAALAPPRPLYSTSQ